MNDTSQTIAILRSNDPELSAAKIALIVGVSRERVRQVLLKLGLPTATSRSRTGFSHTPEYRRWWAMIDRCHNSRCSAYKWYGARGIVVCDRWRNSFDDYCVDVGKRPSSMHSLDRIDVNGNYEPSNVRWATWHEQRMNTTQQASRTSDEVAGKWWRSKRAAEMLVDDAMQHEAMYGWSLATAYRRLGPRGSAAGRKRKA